MNATEITATLSDHEARINNLEGWTSNIESRMVCGDHTARLGNLESWEEKQNGHLVRIEEKVDAMKTMLLVSLGTLVLALLGLVVQLLRAPAA